MASLNYRKCIKDNPFAFGFICLFFLIMLFYLKSIKPECYGDGGEYMLQSIAFQNHLSFGVTTADLQKAKIDFPKYADFLERVYNDHAMHEYKNAKYSNHYGVYSALVAPIMIITRALHINPLRAFSFTNWLLWLCAALAVFFFLNESRVKKNCILILVLLNPIFFYLNWTHTEVFSFAFTVIGLVFYYNKQYSRAILFLSIAAMQNLAINAFGMMVGIDFIISCIVEYRLSNGKFNFSDFIKKFWKKILPYGIFYIPALIPLISTYIRFGTYNLVAKVAMENKYVLSKAFDYLFDLNLGIFPYEPILLITFIVMAVLGLKKNTRTTLINICGIGLMLYIIAHQVQINCGMECIMRYNVWIIPTLIFFCVLQSEKIISSKRITIISCSEALFTVVIVFYAAFLGRFDSNHFAPWTEFILTNMPAVYNPTHGIFYSRCLNQETYSTSFPVCFFDKNGNVRKILFQKDMNLENLYIGNENGKIDVKKQIRKYIDSKDFYYLNFDLPPIICSQYELGSEISFCPNGNADRFVKKGLSAQESEGRWTDGEEFVFETYANSTSAILKCEIDAKGAFHYPQQCTIFVNEQPVFDSTISSETTIRFNFENNKNGLINIKMELPDAVAPSSVMDSPDTRVLGLYLCRMKIYE